MKKKTKTVTVHIIRSRRFSGHYPSNKLLRLEKYIKID